MNESRITELWERYRENRTIEVRNEIVLCYTDLVRKIVLRFNGSYQNYAQLDDMINQGIIALIDSVERFNPDRGIKFETFASLKIKGAVIDFIRKQDWVPRSQRSLVRELEEAYSRLYSENGSEPTAEQLADKLGIPVERLDKILQQKHNSIVFSLEEAIHEKMMQAFPLTDNNIDNELPEPRLLYNELKTKLTEAIGQLNEREKLVISLYYYENLKIKEVAEIMEITESRVSQIHSASVLKIKHRLMNYIKQEV